MKRSIIAFSLAAVMLCSTGCATVLGGKVDECQTQKTEGKQRQIRAGFLIVDIIFGLLPLVVDFATGAIYKKCETR